VFKFLRINIYNMGKRIPIIFLLIDGLADLLSKEKTPLMKANTPNLDYLASKGMVGEINLLPKTIPPNKIYSSLSFLGYDPKRYKIKRGAAEAIGMNIPLKDGDLAWSYTFATLDEKGNILDRKAGLDGYKLDEVVRSINEFVDVSVPYVFLRSYDTRGALVFRGNFSDKVSDNFVYGSKKPRMVKPLVEDKAASLASVITNNFIENAVSVMEYHQVNLERMNKGLLPVNYLIVRGASSKIPNLPDFKEKWKIEKAIVLAEPGVERGVALIAGFDSINFEPINFSSDLNRIFNQLEDLIVNYDFIFVHLHHLEKVCWKQDCDSKIKMIEKIDEKLEFFRNFEGIFVLGSQRVISCKNREDVHSKVPVLVFGKKKDKVKKFDEKSVKKGKIKGISGTKLWSIVFGK